MKQEDMSIWVPVGMSLLGRVIDADGNPCDDGPELFPDHDQNRFTTSGKSCLSSFVFIFDRSDQRYVFGIYSNSG